MEEEARRELARVARRRARRVPRVALARLADLPDRRRARRSATRRRPRSSTPSSSRSPGANVMIGHLVACYGAADRYLGMLAATLGESERARGALRARAWSSTGAWARATWLAHTAYEYARPAAGARRPASASGPRRCSARRRRSRSGSACRRSSAASARSGAADAARPACPTGSPPARSQILGLVARGLSNREIGADAVHQRAHRRQPHPQHPAQDRLRQPHRGRLLRPPARPVEP